LVSFYFFSQQFAAVPVQFLPATSSAFSHPVVQTRPKVLFIFRHLASRLAFQQSRHRHYRLIFF